MNLNDLCNIIEQCFHILLKSYFELYFIACTYVVMKKSLNIFKAQTYLRQPRKVTRQQV